VESLANAASLVVRQKKEWGEILSGFEQRNKYLVSDPGDGDLFAAVERGGSTLARLFLRSLRPFEMQVATLAGRTVLQLRRPFTWYFHRLEVYDEQRRPLGRIERRFAWVRRVYAVFDASGRETHRLFGPVLHPWTFEIRADDRIAGRIVKKWGGLAKEALTDADTFGITFPVAAPAATKAVLLGAVFLIDFVHFEHRD
jgi:uncharacterized protein YxjI